MLTRNGRKGPGPNRSVPIFDRIEEGLSGPAAAWRVVREVNGAPVTKPRRLITLAAVLETIADGTVVVLTAKLPMMPMPNGYLISNGDGDGRSETVALVTYMPKRPAVRLTPSLGIAWGQHGRAWLRLEQLRDALAEGGRAWEGSHLARPVPRRAGGSVAPAIAGTDAADLATPTERAEQPKGRESTRIQGLLAQIGARLGNQVWVPRADRHAIAAACGVNPPVLLDHLPLSCDHVILKMIERIDVLWIKGRSIRRAFEVEHTTPVSSGLGRTVDLLALQPNMDIHLHIVAPDARYEKVKREITRPGFLVPERGPLSSLCTFIAYSSVIELGKLPNLEYMTDRVLEQFERLPGL